MAPASLSHLLVSICELFAAFGGQVIELGAPVVLRRAFVECNPPSLDQTVQRRVQRPLLNLQHVVRSTLDGFGNGMSVSPGRAAASAGSADPACPAAAQSGRAPV